MVGCCVGWFVVVVVVGFWVFFRFPRVSVFILQGKEMDCKDLPYLGCYRVFWGVALSSGVRWKQNALLKPSGH